MAQIHHLTITAYKRELYPQAIHHKHSLLSQPINTIHNLMNEDVLKSYV